MNIIWLYELLILLYIKTIVLQYIKIEIIYIYICIYQNELLTLYCKPLFKEKYKRNEFFTKIIGYFIKSKIKNYL